MQYQTGFLYSDAQQFLKSEPVADSLHVIALAGNKDLSALYVRLAKSTCRFAFYFNTNGPVAEVVLENLPSFYFLPTYYKCAGQPVLFTGPQFSLPQRLRLANAAQSQGYLQLHYVDNIHILDTSVQIRLISYPELGQLLVSGTVFLFACTADKNCNALQQLFNEKKAGFKTTHPQLSAAIEKINACNNALLEKNLEMTILQQTVAVLNASVKGIWANNQAALLQQWYDAEYEVLPLWYKQFGHIIKVLSGKRTFRSLFGSRIKHNAH